MTARTKPSKHRAPGSVKAWAIYDEPHDAIMEVFAARSDYPYMLNAGERWVRVTIVPARQKQKKRR